jgi:hypothetical protein
MPREPGSVCPRAGSCSAGVALAHRRDAAVFRCAGLCCAGALSPWQPLVRCYPLCIASAYSAAPGASKRPRLHALGTNHRPSPAYGHSLHQAFGGAARVAAATGASLAVATAAEREPRGSSRTKASGPASRLAAARGPATEGASGVYARYPARIHSSTGASRCAIQRQTWTAHSARAA